VEIKKVRGHFLNTDNETDRQTDSDSGYKTNLTVKVPSSWAVEEAPPPEDLAEQTEAPVIMNAKPNYPNKKPAKNNFNKNRRRGGRTTDGEFTDTEAYQSDANPEQSRPAATNNNGPLSYAQLLNPNARRPSPRTENNNTKSAKNSPEKKEAATVVDQNNNVVKQAGGDAGHSNMNRKGKQQYEKTNGDKPLPQRQNRNRGPAQKKTLQQPAK
jgi:hypothetical protein